MNFCEGYPIDLSRLLETRLLIQAQSGGGKSWALRRLLEQSAPLVQQLIIDPEGEFATLREKFDYVIAAPHDGDALATPQTAALLARRLLESGVSAVLDIYDLKAHERQLFVRRFLEALVNAPRSLWHPVLVALDEAHIFAPQTGSAESLGAVIDIATRGRKRGLCLVPATQRLSKLHKDVAAEMLNKLIGRTSLDVDVKRAADELGMTPKESMAALRDLDPGQFFAFGPALSRGVEKINIGPVVTTHPKSGQRLMQAPPAPSPKVRAQLAKLADLQKDAEIEARTVDELKAANVDLRRKLATAEKRASEAGVPEVEVQQRIQAAVAESTQQKPAAGITASASMSPKLRKTLERLAELSAQALSETGATRSGVTPRQQKAAPAPAAATGPVSDGLTGPEQRILDAIAWLESIGVDAPEQPAVAFLAGYKFGGGAYNNPRGRLNQRGLVEYRPGGLIALTDQGRELANFPSALASNSELHDRVLQRLAGPEQRLLRPLLNAYPQPMSNTDLAAAAGYTAGAGAFNNPRGRLRSLGLIDYPTPGMVVAKSLLFPK